MLLLFSLLSACSPGNPGERSPVQAGGATATQPPEATPLPVEQTATPTPQSADHPREIGLWLSPDLPAGLIAAIRLPSGVRYSAAKQESDLEIVPGSTHLLTTWTYVLAAPFPSYTDDVRGDDLKRLWTDGTPVGDEGRSLLVDRSTAAVFSALWGTPSQAVRTVPAEALSRQAWKERTTWTILPFEQLEPTWKVLTVDGQSPLRKDFDPTAYPLLAPFSLAGEKTLADEMIAVWGPRSASPLLPSGNRDPGRLTTVLLTGVTALVRGTAVMMETQGMDYPAADIGPILRQADILHINNEVPFAKNCPAPYPWEGLVFCSQERYIQLMESIGTDIVELAGDHFADWGADAMRFTLDLYRQRGWPVYGGGENIEAAKKPAYFEHNGNKIAFIGCNYKAPGYATARQNNPGAVHCDPDWLVPLVRKVKEEGYLPIVTFQHEEYYEYIARPKLQTDFRAVAAAGAVIASGSQAHQPHALEFYRGSLLHYGLGNLFFDQVGTDEATRWAFMDRHVFYGGRHIGTELIAIVFVDLARSRLATPEEKRALLEKVFTAGGW